MNDLSDSLEPLILTQAEPFQHCFKGAVFALVSEFHSEHIEGNSTFDCLTFIHEVESWTLVDELPD